MSVLRALCFRIFASFKTQAYATILFAVGFVIHPCFETARAQSTIADYDRIVADAMRCTPEEPCTIAGGVKGCRCPSAVRASEAQRVSVAAKGATCPQIERLYCPPLRAPHCNDGRCAAEVVSY
jgi:hypothetical protein